MRLRECSELPRQKLQVREDQGWLGLSCPKGAWYPAWEAQVSLGFLPLRGPGLLLGGRWGLPGGS